MEALLEQIKPFLEMVAGSFLGQNGPALQVVFTILLIMGTARSVFKLLSEAARVVVKATPSDADDKLLDNVEQSAVVKTLKFLADYFLSIKLPPKQ